MIQKPEKLNPGDNIGIVAPAGAFDMDEFSDGVKVLETFGFNLIYSESLFERNGYFAGGDEIRAESFNSMIENPDIKAVLCARGGFGSMKILDSIDYSKFSQTKKILVGFSDITALLISIAETTGVVTFHGPVITNLGTADSETLESLANILNGHNDFRVDLKGEETIIAGKCSGRVSGGNLATLCHLTGTPYQPDLTGKILVIEDIAEPLYKIDRMLTQMNMAGVFDGVSGAVLGTFEKCGDIAEIYRLFKKFFSGINVPVAGGFKIGHGETNITVPIGAMADFNADERILRYV